MLTFRYTLVAPGFCPFCLGEEDKKPDERFQQWVAKATLLNHIDRHFDGLKTSTTFFCPHPCCRAKDYGSIINLRRHFFDAHSIDETRSNCVNRKRKWRTEPEYAPEDNTQAHPEVSAIQEFSNVENPHKKGKTASSDEVQITEKFLEQFTCYDESQAYHEVGISIRGSCPET